MEGGRAFRVHFNYAQQIMVWRLFSLILILLSFIVGVFLYPKLPSKMASHWNLKGEVDGFMPKSWGVFSLPILCLGLFLLLLFIPEIDPLKKNVKNFRRYYDAFIFSFILFLFYIYLVLLAWNLGFDFNVLSAIIPALSFLFYFLGVLLEHAKRNWFIGIRTPWTLSNNIVWRMTHLLGGRLFKLLSLFVLLGFFIPPMDFYVLLLIFLSVIMIFLVFYSYLESVRVECKKKNK